MPMIFLVGKECAEYRRQSQKREYVENNQFNSGNLPLVPDRLGANSRGNARAANTSVVCAA